MTGTINIKFNEKLGKFVCYREDRDWVCFTGYGETKYKAELD